MPKITFDEVLDEIQRLNDQQPEGFTVKEMVTATGKTPEWCRSQIGGLIDDGKAVYNGRKKSTAIDGRTTHRPVYKLTA